MESPTLTAGNEGINVRETVETEMRASHSRMNTTEGENTATKKRSTSQF